MNTKVHSYNSRIIFFSAYPEESLHFYTIFRSYSKHTFLCFSGVQNVFSVENFSKLARWCKVLSTCHTRHEKIYAPRWNHGWLWRSFKMTVCLVTGTKWLVKMLPVNSSQQEFTYLLLIIHYIQHFFFAFFQQLRQVASKKCPMYVGFLIFSANLLVGLSCIVRSDWSS